MAGRTQAALYAALDHELSWSEDDLPQSERTKHVHRLHPYLGKFVPQLVEVFLRRLLVPGQRVYDPFHGSGTTLVEANAYGCEAVGADVSAFNCLLTRVKTARHELAAVELALRGTLERSRRDGPPPGTAASPWLAEWYAPGALEELLAYREAASALPGPVRDVAHVVLSRAARSARLAAHFDLDFPRAPVRAPYWCHKHRRECRPVADADGFLRRYTADAVRRLRAFAPLRTQRPVLVLHADARSVELPAPIDAIITSPPYPGLIDYHEQHRYAYELLGLEDRRGDEIGSAAAGRTRGALADYSDGIVAAFANGRAALRPGAPVAIVVNDRRALYPAILERAGLVLEQRLTRHVNRRTGRRAGEFFEDVLLCRAA